MGVQTIAGSSQLLLNVCIVIIGSMTFELILPTVKPFTKTLLVQAVLNTEMVLCMSFPFSEAQGFSFDLRAVPMVIGPLYGGPATSAAMLAIYVVYRVILGGTQTIKGLIIGITLVTISLLMSRFFTGASRIKKVLIAFVPMVLLLTGLDVLLWRSLADIHRPLVLATYDAINLIVLGVTILGIEYVAENVHLSQEINRAEKLHVVGELAASIAHEIRNPMTVTRGFLQLAIQSHRVPSDEKRYLTTAVEELDRAHGIIDDYLSLARPSAEAFTCVDLDKQVQHSVEMLQPYSHLHNVTIAFHRSEGLSVHADPKKLTQLFVNVMKNAIEAMPEGGKLTIRNELSKKYAGVSIRDTGIGMTEEELKRLGSPFYSTKANGTGLGLMASYQICRSMGGRIEVSSTPGKGTEFVIWLPLTSQVMDGTTR